jgi:NADPH2:quinone reductase
VHAIRLHAFGPAENLRCEAVPTPQPGPGQVRVAVEAAGVHLIDTTVRRGVQMGPIPLPSLPAIPGREVAGRVEAVGDDAAAPWLGRRVVAHLGPLGSGGYAEQAVVDVARLHALPEDGLSADAAVTAIGTGRTAQMILDAAAIAADDVVLVPAAAGALGALLVQAARRAGAEVVALAGGPEKVALAERFGAMRALDYRDGGWAARAGAVTLVLDGVGGEVGRAAQSLLRPGGRSVVFGWSSGEPAGSPNLPRPEDLRPYERRALDAFATGALTAHVHPAFPLAGAAAAHTALETRATAGKVVLRP